MKTDFPLLVLHPGVKPLPHSLPSRNPDPLFASFELIGVIGSLTLLFACVLAFGAVETWSMTMLQVGAVTLFAAWAVVQAFRGRVAVQLHPLFAPAVFFGLIVSFQVVTGLSAYAYQTRVSFLLYTSYAVLLFVAVQFFRWKSHFQTAAWMLTSFGFVLALFAIVQDFTSDGLLYWVRQPSQGGSIYGPYVNRNHYAGMMEMLFVFPLALSMSELVSPAKRWLLALAGTFMATSVIFSHSRGGMAVMLLQILLLSAFMLRRRQSHRAIRTILVLVPVVCLAWYLGTSTILHRWAEASTADRFPIWRDVVPMILDKPIMGSGLGTFSTAFPRFRSIYSSLFINAAHNDYLQVLAETGIVGALAFVWFIVTLYRGTLPQLRSWHQDWITCTRLAALAGCTGILLHSFVDFNLQIPANAAMFLFMAAIAVSGGSEPDSPGQATGDENEIALSADNRKKGVLKSIADAGHTSSRRGQL